MNLIHERAEDEIADDAQLATVFGRELAASLRVNKLARLLYEARALYVGGACLPWSDLTPQQRRGYRAEIERLVRGVAQ